MSILWVLASCVHCIRIMPVMMYILQPILCVYRWIGVTEANETLQSTLENFATENYVFVREKLARWVRIIVRLSPSNLSA